MYSIRDVFVTQSHILLNSYFFFPEIHRKADSRKEKKATRGQTTKGKGSKREEAKA